MLKYWQVISTPGLEKYDDILLDEAQDANPVILAALEGKRVIYVGDTHQQIYGVRGAVDAMNAIVDSQPHGSSNRLFSEILTRMDCIPPHNRATTLG